MSIQEAFDLIASRKVKSKDLLIKFLEQRGIEKGVSLGLIAVAYKYVKESRLERILKLIGVFYAFSLLVCIVY